MKTTSTQTHLYAFNKDQNIVLDAPIRVDIGGVEGRITAGTEVASHYVFFDSHSGAHYGFVDFDAPILGIAAYQDTMGATDFLANTSVTCTGTNLCSLEKAVWSGLTIRTRLAAGSIGPDRLPVTTPASLLNAP